MKKIFCILLASLLLITVAVSCADNKAEGQTTENTSEVVKTSVESTSTQEENPGETTTDDIGTTAVDTTEVDTTEVGTAEPEPTETIAEPNPNEALFGTFICDSEWFKSNGFPEEPEYIPLLRLNSDGSMIWRVYYIGGVVDLGGTYVVEDNKVCIYPVLDGSPVDGVTIGGTPYMDDYFELDIIDENTLVMRRVEENYRKGACYEVKVGDAFVRE